MPRPLVWILVTVTTLVTALFGLAIAVYLVTPNETQGALDTRLTDVTVVGASTVPESAPAPQAEPEDDSRCWRSFGGDPQRSLSRAAFDLGIPARKILWTRGLDSYIEYPPSYCEGTLYVNAFEGEVFAIDATNGKVRWRRAFGGTKPSTPAIDGPRLIVSSRDGTVTALDRERGRLLWQVSTSGKVESSPVVVDGLVYFGSTDGRLFAVQATNGRVRWAYDTGGRINSSPSVWGRRVCISTYAGSVFCLDRSSGRRLWSTYLKRDAFRYESFYASVSTDGARLYTVARSGKVVALDATNGDLVWTAEVGGLGYTTPAIGHGLVFVGGFDGTLRALRATTGREIWQADTSGRILGAPVVVGDLVFFSTLEKRTYAARVSDGKIVWKLPMGRYSPGIATERTYYFSLNGRLIAVRGRNTVEAS